MNEIPLPYVKANQTGIVTFVIIAAIAQQPWLIALLWVIEAAGLAFGMKGNLFVRIAKPLLRKRIAGALTEARELTRFNNTLAVIFLSLAVLFFALQWTVAAYVMSGMLALAALGGLLGYCVGCFLFYQYKQLKNRIALKRYATRLQD